MIKRTIKIIILVFAIGLFLCLCYILFGGAAANDLRAIRIEKDLSDMTLPANTELVEVTSFVGNTSGTGNHVEIWAGILIQTALDESEVRNHFDGFDVFAVPNDLTSQMPYQKDFIDFRSLNDTDTAYGYYVISKYFDAFTQVDLSGH